MTTAVGVFTINQIRSLTLVDDFVAIGNKTHGYCSGGYDGTNALSSVGRISFANDLSISNPRGKLPTPLDFYSSTVNSTDNWVFTGTTTGASTQAVSNIKRITFVTDLGTISFRANDTLARAGSSAAGNLTDGYNGGSFVSGVTVSNIARLIYSQDLTAMVNKANFSVVKSGQEAQGNYSDSWHVGGTTDGGTTIISVVDRYNYATELVNAVAKGILGINKYAFAAVTNFTDMWCLGGQISGSIISSTARITFSSDTVAASVRTSLNAIKQGTGNAFTSSDGWIIQGWNTSPLSTVERISFAADTSVLVRGPSCITSGLIQ